MIRVFVSSIRKGLERVRGQVREAIEQAGFAVEGMETFGAQPRPPLEVCLAQVRRSHVVVLIIGPHYGSRVPDGTISYTHAEYREARSRDIPVLAFRVTSEDSGSEADREGLATLTAEAGAAQMWQNIDIDHDGEGALGRLPGLVLAALHRAEQEGHLGRTFRLFLDADRFYSTHLRDPASKLSHRSSLVGRDTELEQLRQFISGSLRLFVLEAPGGTGKSRLLLEAARTASGSKVFFVDPEARWSEEQVNLVPTGPAVFVFDDAHRRGDLDSFIGACLARNPDLRFIVSCRPAAADQVRVLLRGLLAHGEAPTLRLQPLSEAAAVQLAESELGPEYRHAAADLVRVADRNPLVVLVGAKCIRESLVVPEMLSNKPDSFRSVVLDHLLNDPGLKSEDAAQRRALLEIIAAIGPVRIDDAVLREHLAGRLGEPESAIARMLGELDRHGFLIRRGGLARVTPDVLADHLLQSAAVTPDGLSTGFVDEMLELFGSGHLSQLIGNAAELDWRLAPEGHASVVLAKIWKRIRDGLPDLTTYQRSDLLRRLERALRFAPEQVLEVAESIMDAPPAPEASTDDVGVAAHWTIGVAESTSRVYRICATHPRFTNRCLRRLWRLAEHHAEEYPDRANPAAQALQDLLKYDGSGHWLREKSYQEQTLQMVCKRLVEPDRKRPALWAIRLLETALNRTGETSSSNGITFSWGSFSLTDQFDTLWPRRLLALESLARVAMGIDAAEAIAATVSLGRRLVRPDGGLGQSLTKEQAAQWLPEVTAAAESLREIAHGAQTEYIRYLARRELREKRSSSWTEATPVIARVLRLTNQLVSESLLDAVTSPPRDYAQKDYKRRQSIEARQTQRVAHRLWREHGTAKAVVKSLDTVLASLAELGIDAPWHCPILVSAICRTNPGEAVKVAEHLRGPRISAFLRCAISAMHEQDATAECRRIIAECCEHADESTRVAGLDALQWLLAQDPPTQRDLDLVRRRVNDTPWVIHYVSLVLARFRNILTHEAIEVLLLVEWNDDPRIAAHVLEAFEKQYHIHPENLSKPQFEDILGRIARLPSLDAGHYQLGEFINYACECDPDAVTAMFIARVQRADVLKGSQSHRFEAVPHPVHKQLPLPDAARTRCATMVRNASLAYETMSDFWWPVLFQLVCGSSTIAAEVLTPWLASQDSAKLLACAHLLKEFPHDTVYAEHQFVAGLLTAAESDSSTTCEDVRRLLYGLATGGSWHGTPGQPMPRDVEDAKSAAETAQHYSPGEPAERFFRKLEAAAKRRIEQSKREWEEETFD